MQFFGDLFPEEPYRDKIIEGLLDIDPVETLLQEFITLATTKQLRSRVQI